MGNPIIGWHSTQPVPDQYRFNSYLQAKNGRLQFNNLDLVDLFSAGWPHLGVDQTFPSPLEVVYLPYITRKIEEMNRFFQDVREELGYDGAFHYAYASKANTAEEIVRTAVNAGAHYEMSSAVDVQIARYLHQAGLLPSNRMVIANGFKAEGSVYAAALLRFKQEHDNLIPVVEDLTELPPLLESTQPFQVGLRQKSYGDYQTVAEMEGMNSRFGLNTADLEHAAQLIHESEQLELTLYHAMIGSQITDPAQFVARLRPTIETYAKLRQTHPSLQIYNIGGGIPVGLTLDFRFDYRAFFRHLLGAFQQVCAEYAIPVPDIMAEFGRYTTAEHATHLFKVVTVKNNRSKTPWYIIDGSIMTSFPDTWALGEHFIVLPLNHLDKPFRPVQLGGITCDSDDIYPQDQSSATLYLPDTEEDLYVGFFAIGAYQEMLGGVRGTKHCALPEATELLIEQSASGSYQFKILEGQTEEDVLQNLGYGAGRI